MQLCALLVNPAFNVDTPDKIMNLTKNVAQQLEWLKQLM